MKMDSFEYKNILQKGIGLIGGLLLSAVLTIGFLALFAFLMLQMELSTGAENVGLILICILSCFAGGFFCGKKNKTKGFLWGLAIGLLYYIVIVLLRLCVGNNLPVISLHFITAFFYCGASGMLGGMLS